MRRWPVRAFICPGLARQANLDLGAILKNLAFAALRAPGEFPKVEVGYWDHSLSRPSAGEPGANMLWLETLGECNRSSQRVAFRSARNIGQVPSSPASCAVCHVAEHVDEW